MFYRKLQMSDSDAYWDLIGITIDALPNKEFWLPFNKETQDNLFDPDWVVLYGAFDENRLVGAGGLFLHPLEYSESVSYMSSKFESVAKLDRFMVHPDYWGQGISVEIFNNIREEAQKLERKTLIATVHPKNIHGKNLLTKIGMELQCAYLNKDGYFRNVFVINLVEKKKGLFGGLFGGKQK